MGKLFNFAGIMVCIGVLFFIIAGIMWDEPLAVWIGGIVGAVFLGYGYVTRND
jgi:hypothetical protein